jgi:hypothetical protein
MRGGGSQITGECAVSDAARSWGPAAGKLQRCMRLGHFVCIEERLPCRQTAGTAMTWGWEKRTHSHEHHVADGQLRRVAVRCGMHQLLDDLARREIPQLAHLLCGHLNFVARTEVGMGGGGGDMTRAPSRSRRRSTPFCSRPVTTHRVSCDWAAVIARPPPAAAAAAASTGHGWKRHTSSPVRV